MATSDFAIVNSITPLGDEGERGSRRGIVALDDSASDKILEDESPSFELKVRNSDEPEELTAEQLRSEDYNLTHSQFVERYLKSPIEDPESKLFYFLVLNESCLDRIERDTAKPLDLLMLSSVGWLVPELLDEQQKHLCLECSRARPEDFDEVKKLVGALKHRNPSTHGGFWEKETWLSTIKNGGSLPLLLLFLTLLLRLQRATSRQVIRKQKSKSTAQNSNIQSL